MIVLFLLLALQDQEDARAKAVREAFEEQLRREKSILELGGRRVVRDFELDPEGLDYNGAREFMRLWADPDPAAPELYASLEEANLERVQRTIRLMSHLWGRRSPIPRDAASLEAIRRQWEAWRRDPRPAPCTHPEAELRGFIERVGHEDVGERLAAERALEPCAFRHRALFEEALRGATDVEAAARLRVLAKAVEPGPLGEEGRAVVRKALELSSQTGSEAAVAALRAGRARFGGHHARTLDLVLRALVGP